LKEQKYTKNYLKTQKIDTKYEFTAGLLLSELKIWAFENENVKTFIKD